IVFPDHGAYKRYSEFFPRKEPLLYIDKVRDFATGSLTDMKLAIQPQHTKFKAIIVDDICSRGGTFKWAAQILKDAGAEEVGLVVTYGERKSMTDAKMNVVDTILDEIHVLNYI